MSEQTVDQAVSTYRAALAALSTLSIVAGLTAMFASSESEYAAVLPLLGAALITGGMVLGGLFLAVSALAPPFRRQ